MSSPEIDYKSSYEAALDELCAALSRLDRVERSMVSRGFIRRPLPVRPRIEERVKLEHSEPLDLPPPDEAETPL